MGQTIEPNGELARAPGHPLPEANSTAGPATPRVGTEEGRGYRGGTSCSQPPGCERAVGGSVTRKSCCTQQCGKWAREEAGSGPAAGWWRAQAEHAESLAQKLSLSPVGGTFDPWSPWPSISGCLCFHLVGLRHRGTQVRKGPDWEARDMISFFFFLF